MDKRPFKKLGLSDDETELYLTLLRDSPISAYELYKRTTIHRSHVYDKLELLMQKGLVGYISRGNRRVYQAMHPNKLFDYIDDREENLKSIRSEFEHLLPALNSMNKRLFIETSAEVQLGIEGIKYVLKDVLRCGSNVMLVGVEEERYAENVLEPMKKYFHLLIDKGLKEKVIIAKKPKLVLFNTPTTIYRFIDSEIIYPAHTWIYGDKVVLTSWRGQINTIIIKNKSVADTYRTQFRKLWAIAEKKPKGSRVKYVDI